MWLILYLLFFLCMHIAYMIKYSIYIKVKAIVRLIVQTRALYYIIIIDSLTICVYHYRHFRHGFIDYIIGGTVAVRQITRNNYIWLCLLVVGSIVVLIMFQMARFIWLFCGAAYMINGPAGFSLILFRLFGYRLKVHRHTAYCIHTPPPSWLEYIVDFRSKQESGYKFSPERINGRVTFCLYIVYTYTYMDCGRYAWTKNRIYGLFAIFGFHVYCSVRFALMSKVFTVEYFFGFC